MSPRYRIDTDADHDLLIVTLDGFCTLEDVTQLRVELGVAIRSLKCRLGTHLSLWDIRECKIQSQDVVAIFRAMSDAKGIVARRLAVVTGTSLMRMQLHRILVGRDARSFDDVASARAWLRSGPPPALPANGLVQGAIVRNHASR